MSQQADVLAEAAETLFADIRGDLGTRDIDASTFRHTWDQICDLGLPQVLVPESLGGIGGDWEDAAAIASAAGRHALPMPVIEAMLAGFHLAVHGSTLLPGSLPAIAVGGQGEIVNTNGQSRLTGVLQNVPWGRFATDIVASIQGPDRALVHIALHERAGANIREGNNLAGEPRDEIAVNNCPVTVLSRLQTSSLFDHAALLRTAQIAGSLQRALDMTVEYAKARQQFGRPIAQFQAVQQQIAGLASEVAAVTCGARAAAVSAVHAPATARFSIGCAKLRANSAIGVATATAHQVHAAIGFTQEYPLHLYTRRLWSWHSEYGNDRYWRDYIGAAVCESGSEGFWPALTALDHTGSLTS